MQRRDRRTRGAVTWWLALVGAGLVGAGGWWTVVGEEDPVPASLTIKSESDPDAGSVDSDLVTLLLRAGLSAEKLCAVGVSDDGVGDLIQEVKDLVGGNYGPLTQADLDHFTCKTACEALERKVRSGKAEQGDVAQLQQLVQDQASYLAARDGLLQSFATAAGGAMTQAQVALIAQIASNDSWGVPMEFKVVARSEAAWVDLREALWNERIAPRYGEDPDPTAQALLTAARADATVSAAKTALDTLLPAVQAAWDTACVD